MGQLSEAQSYVDRVKGVCKKFSSPYRINNCPETDCEEGWAWLKCGGSRYERAKVCFEKALERKPKNPEFNIGWAIACYRLDAWPPNQNPINPLREAIRLNPSNQYVKILLALKLQKLGEEEEAESIVEEALEKGPHAIDALCSAAKFYRKKGAFDKAIEVLGETLEAVPNNAYLHYYMGCCYRAKALQIQHERYEEKEKLPELIEQAVDHLKKADELNVNVSNVCSYLAGLYTLKNQYEEADYYFQKELRKDLNPVAKQLLHLRYGNFQLYQMRCEEKAIHYFTEGVKIKQPSKEREKMKNKLQRIAKMRLSQNRTDAETLCLLSVLDELNGEMQQAGGDSERFRLTSLLPSAPMVEAGDDSHVPSVA